MPTFIYKAKINPAKLQEGTIEAENQEQAVKKVNDLGLFPVEIKPQEPIKNINLFTKLRSQRKIQNQDVITFTRQLASLLESGLNILPALNVIKGQILTPSFSSLINAISEDVKQGESFSESLSRHKNIFSSLYINIVRSGELSGRLTTALDSLADFLEGAEELRQRIISALIYPMLVLTVGVLAVIFLLAVVIPRIGSMYEEMGQVLPLPTQIVVGISTIILQYFWFFALLVGIFIFMINRIVKTDEGRNFLDRVKLKTLLLGAFIQKQHIVQFSRTLALLLSSGIPIVTSLELTANTLTNRLIRTEVEIMAKKVREGESLSASIQGAQYFPSFVTNIMAIAEESGSLDRALTRIAGSFERDIERIIKRFTVILEPVLIILIGLAVTFILISMLLPIFQINLIVG